MADRPIPFNAPMVRAGDVIVVWFSNGAASAIAAQETLKKYGSYCDIRLVNNPVAEEDGDNGWPEDTAALYRVMINARPE